MPARVHALAGTAIGRAGHPYHSHLFEASPSTTILIRRRFDEQLGRDALRPGVHLFATSMSTTSTHSEPFRKLVGSLSLNLTERIDTRSLEDASACFISIAYLHICIKTWFVGQNCAMKWRFGENVGSGRSCGKEVTGKVAGEGRGG